MKKFLVPISVLSILAVAALFILIFRQKPESVSPSLPSATSSTQTIQTTQPSTLDRTPIKLVPQLVTLSNGKSFTLQVADGFTVTPAYQGTAHFRFMAWSPDGRLFVTDTYSASDNTLGKIYILENFNTSTKTFATATTYLSNLRNPNNVAFYTDPTGKIWLYTALTDKLVRYEYHAGDTVPTTAPETLASFPDYGASLQQGGWHLTRTVAFHDDKLYVSVGSSCDLCEEKTSEPQRASILEMNPDGSGQRIYANGLRNAVGIKWIGDNLFATAMSPDHLGDDVPQDTFQLITDGVNYGWPYCYEQNGAIQENNSIPWTRKNIDCANVPLSYDPLGAHIAPLGFDYFGSSSDPTIKNYFLVGLHGSGDPRIGRGYAVERVQKNIGPEVVVGGFLQNGVRYGRPVDVLSAGDNAFFFTDDFGGVVYYVSKTLLN